MIQIWFEDINWTNEDGEVIPMEHPMQINAYGRIISRFEQPVITNDTWGGKTFKVQITNTESYRAKFAVKELSVHALAKMLSCKKVWVKEFATNEVHEIDTETDGKMMIESTNVGSSEQSVIFTYSTKKTCVYPGIARLNTNNLNITYSGTYNFYSDKPILEWISDFEKYDDDKVEIGRKGVKMVFYLLESDAMDLKELISKVQPSGISINPLTDNYTPIEAGTCILTELTEGLFRCEVSYPTEKIVLYPGIAISNTNNLNITDSESTEYDFYTDEDISEWVSDFEHSEFNYNSGKTYVSKATGKRGIKMIFYLLESDAMDLKELVSKVQPSGIDVNSSSYTITEMGTCTLTELTEGLYKCEVMFTTENIIEYA
jgi:hypothetical protein